MHCPTCSEFVALFGILNVFLSRKELIFEVKIESRTRSLFILIIWFAQKNGLIFFIVKNKACICLEEFCGVVGEQGTTLL